MENMSDLVKKYFLFLENHSQLWTDLGKKMTKSVGAIECLGDQLHATSSIGTDNFIKRQFPNLEEQVIYKTFMSLEQELLPITNMVQEVARATEKLNKLASFIDQPNDLNGYTPASISVSMLLECVSDSRQYYQAQNAGLQISYKCLNIRDRNTINDFRKSLTEDSTLRKHIQGCLFYGKQYISILDDTAALSLES